MVVESDVAPTTTNISDGNPLGVHLQYANLCPCNPRFVRLVEAKSKNYQPDGCVLRVTINLPGIIFHFVEYVDLVGADNKHLEMAG